MPSKKSTNLTRLILAISVLALAMLFILPGAHAQAPIPPAITTPHKVDTTLGTLDFKDGAPSAATLDKDLRQPRLHARIRGVREHDAGRQRRSHSQGLADIGVKDNEVLVFSELMDAKSLFLTANADTVYFVGGLDLARGRWCWRRRPRRSAPLTTLVALGHRFRRARSRPRRRRQISVRCRPDTTVRCPKAGSLSPAPAPTACWFGRMFMENNDPKPAVDLIKE